MALDFAAGCAGGKCLYLLVLFFKSCVQDYFINYKSTYNHLHLS